MSRFIEKINRPDENRRFAPNARNARRLARKITKDVKHGSHEKQLDGEIQNKEGV